MSRLMAKNFEAEIERNDDGSAKGAALQSKINSFLKEKVVTAIHGLSVARDGNAHSAFLLFSVDEGKPAVTDRVFSKVILEAPRGKETASKVNQFTSGKNYEVRAATSTDVGDTTDVVVLYSKPDATEEPAAAEAPAEQAEAVTA